MTLPLVSVIISTYNSSQYVVETLESVAGQTWRELELIITDDNSKDNTVELCSKWLEQHEDRFVVTNLLTSPINTGISANANRGLKVSEGRWIKFLGADDLLLANCIENNINYVINNPEAEVVFSKVNLYKNLFLEENYQRTVPGQIKPSSILWPDRSSESQYRMLLVSDRIHFSPSVFIRREAIVSVGGFDERFRLLEDYPLWLNLTKRGKRLFYFDNVTVNYRIHSDALNNKGLRIIVNPNYFKNESFRRMYIYPNLPKDIKYYQRYNYLVLHLFKIKILNKQSVFNRFLHSLVTAYLNPFKYLIWFKKRLFDLSELKEFYA